MSQKLIKCWKFLLHNPAVSVVLILLVTALSVGLGVYALLYAEPRPVIDFSIKAFGIPNHLVSRYQDAFDVAVQDYASYYRSTGQIHKRSINRFGGEDSFKRKLSDHSGGKYRRSVVASQYERSDMVYLIYLAVEGDNIFTVDHIASIKSIEDEISKIKQFESFCYKAGDTCAPLNSLIPVIYWSMNVQNNQTFSQDVLDYAVQQTLSTTYGIYFTDGHVNNTYFKSRFLRSEIQFGLPLPGYKNREDRKDEQQMKFKEFLSQLTSFFSSVSTRGVRVLYGGNAIFDYQVSKTFWNDLSLAAFSVGAIVVLMLVLTSFSIWFTFCGLGIIMLSFPLAFSVYHLVFKVINLGVLNGVAIFVVVGIGVDDVFIFLNTFRQASAITSFYDRMLLTIKTAGVATFFTSFTTAAAFAANYFSAIPAVHEFGLFMALVITSCWILVMLLMPPVINIWYCWFRRCESFCFKCCSVSQRCGFRKIPDDVANFLQPSSDTAKNVLPSSRSVAEVDDDNVRLLNLPFDDSDGEALLMLSDEEIPATFDRTSRLMYDPGDDDDDSPLLLESTLQSQANYVGNSEECETLLEASSGRGEESQLDVERSDVDDDPLLLESSSEVVVYREGCTLTIHFQSMLYYYLAVPVVYARHFIIGAFVILLIISIVFLSRLRPASKPPQLYRPDTNLQMMLDLMVNYSNQGVSLRISDFVDPSAMTAPRTQVHNIEPSTTPSIDRLSLPTISSSHSQQQQFSSTTDRHQPQVPSTTHQQQFLSTTDRHQPQVPSTTHQQQFLSTTDQHQPQVPSTTHQSITWHSSSYRTTQSVRPSSEGSTSKTSFSSYRPEPSIHPWSTTSNARTLERWTATIQPTSRNPVVNIPQHISLERGVTVYILFGIKDIDRSNISNDHVVSEKGKVVYDNRVQDSFNIYHLNESLIADACRLCRAFMNNSELVKRGSGHCVPSAVSRLIGDRIEECRGIPTSNSDSKPLAAVYAQTYLKWFGFSFESTTYKGMSSFAAYSQYLQWQQFVDDLRESLPQDSPLRSMYSTSEFWKQVIMEIVAVSSAVYGLVLSLVICVVAVAIFTGHLMLLCITAVTMIGMLCLIMAIFYWAGWELGAIEAISLSILVGSSVDYCVHIVEGYILAGKHLPSSTTSQGASETRQWRARVAVSHVGVAVFSSALTTLIAAIPLTQTILLPFSRFGQIVAISAAVSFVYALTVCISFLALCAPFSFTGGLRPRAVAITAVAVVVGAAVLILYIVVRAGNIHIPGPNGLDLFT